MTSVGHGLPWAQRAELVPRPMCACGLHLVEGTDYSNGKVWRDRCKPCRYRLQGRNSAGRLGSFIDGSASAGRPVRTPDDGLGELPSARSEPALWSEIMRRGRGLV
jgi:hypothetical protein